jgi:tetratricopeptide (TPR) repeat protein
MGLNVSRQTQNPKREALFCNNIGGAWSALGEMPKALAYFQLALPSIRAVGDRDLEATTLNNIGGAWSALGEKRKALEYYEQALDLFREVGDRDGEATALNNIGAVWDALGNKRKALEYFEQALELARAVGNRGGEAITLNNIGRAWSKLGKQRTALEYFEQALPVFRAVGDRGGEATTLNNIGLAWSALGEKRKALEYYDQALPVFHILEERGSEAVTCFNIAMVHRALGDLDQAIRYLERCVQLDEEIDHPNLERHRQILERVRRERDGETTEQESQEDQAAEVREMLKGQAPDAVIEQLIKQLAQAGNRQPAQSTLPDDAVQMLARNSVAVMTGVPEKREEWRNVLETQRMAWSGQGDSWQIEVEFADALLAILDAGQVSIPAENPYAPVVRQVLDQIESYGKEDYHE